MILNSTMLDQFYQIHLDRQRKIWKDLENSLYLKYVGMGYWEGFAEEKAKREVLELRSLPRKEEI